METPTQTTAERQALVDRLAEIKLEESRALVEPLKAIEKSEAELVGLKDELAAAERDLAAARIRMHEAPHQTTFH